jgi:hypothetical protein
VAVAKIFGAYHSVTLSPRKHGCLVFEAGFVGVASFPPQRILTVTIIFIILREIVLEILGNTLEI